jgi:hypothetical protein
MIVCENINKLQENTINQYDRITKKEVRRWQKLKKRLMR